MDCCRERVETLLTGQQVLPKNKALPNAISSLTVSKLERKKAKDQEPLPAFKRVKAFYIHINFKGGGFVDSDPAGSRIYKLLIRKDNKTIYYQL